VHFRLFVHSTHVPNFLLSLKKRTGNFRCVLLLPVSEKQALVRFLRLIFQYSPSENIELGVAKDSSWYALEMGRDIDSCSVSDILPKKLYTHIV